LTEVPYALLCGGRSLSLFPVYLLLTFGWMHWETHLVRLPDGTTFTFRSHPPFSFSSERGHGGRFPDSFSGARPSAVSFPPPLLYPPKSFSRSPFLVEHSLSRLFPRPLTLRPTFKSSSESFLPLLKPIRPLWLRPRIRPKTLLARP